MKHLSVLALALAPALCGWTVTHERDRMTDRQTTWASAASGDATLLVGCLNGRVSPRLTWQSRKGFGSGIGVTWRVDDGPMQMHAAGLFSQAGDVLYPWVSSAPDLTRAKRLRVGISGAVYDFDLVAGGQGLPAIKC